MLRAISHGVLAVTALCAACDSIRLDSAAFGSAAGAAPKSPLLRLAPRDVRWTIVDLRDTVRSTTGISILFDSCNCNEKALRLDLFGEQVVAKDRLFEWAQSAVASRKWVLVPLDSESSRRQQWFLMSVAYPNSRRRVVYVPEDQVQDWADREDVYVVSTLTLHVTSDTTRMRNALAPLCTEADGLGRLQDVPGSRKLIVGDYAPVVASMQRRAQFIELRELAGSVTSDVVNLLR